MKWGIILSVGICVCLLAGCGAQETSSESTLMAQGDIAFGEYNGGCVRLIMTDGEYYTIDEVVASVGVYDENYEGQYALQLVDAQGSVLDEISLNQDRQMDKINFAGEFDICIGDYNGDNLPDFTIGTAGSSSMNLMWIYSVDASGKLINTGEFMEFTHDFSVLPQLEDGVCFYATIWNNATCEEEKVYYDWDAENKKYVRVQKTCQTYQTITVGDYEVALKDLEPDVSLQLAVADTLNGQETTLREFSLENGIYDIDNISLNAVDGLMGMPAFSIEYMESGLFPYTDYYGITDGKCYLLGDGTDEEFIIDVDGDGVTELICNKQYFADGAREVIICKWDGEKVMYGCADELLTEEYDNHGVGAIMIWYLPDKNVVKIDYWVDDIGAYKSAEYEIDLSRIEMYEYSVYGLEKVVEL